MDHDNKDAYIFAESIKDGAWPNRDMEDNAINYELVNSWENVIGVSNEVIVKDKHDMDLLRDINKPWVESMIDHGVNTLVLCPLKQNKAIFGYLYVVNYNVSKVVEIKEFLELMSFFLGSEISNYLLYEKLEEISQVDVLTGLNNRRAMKLRLDRMSARKELTPFGVVNMDLNGLKVANDLYGHEAGDALLIYASEILKSVFSHENIYRTGGDEFLVIKEDVSQESFRKKIKHVREEALKYPDISFAIGDFWSDGTTDITSAFQHADERMYADKKAYYDSHPEKERRGTKGI
jgi:diguanylate cyclase (GGDEF)-like protein